MGEGTAQGGQTLCVPWTGCPSATASDRYWGRHTTSLAPWGFFVLFFMAPMLTSYS